MGNILEIRNLTKVYDGFTLEGINLDLPQGSIMGFIGENGAGKSTTIKLILNLIKRDSGTVKIFGHDIIKHENLIKEDLGVVFDEGNFPETMRVRDINVVMRNIYQKWDRDLFFHYLKEFSLPEKKTIKSFSRGMKMKLSIAVALSHNPKFLILDEATSGLDPIIRDEILDMFLEFIQKEDRAIFVSSHISSDIEKIADYIAFIHQGKIVFVESKDDLVNKYGILKCKTSEFRCVDRKYVKGYRQNKFGVEALVEKSRFSNGYLVDNASIEDIMLYTIRGGA